MTPAESIRFVRAAKDSAFVADRIIMLRDLERAGIDRLDPLRLADVKALPGVERMLRSHGDVLLELQGKYPDDGEIAAAVVEWRAHATRAGLLSG